MRQVPVRTGEVNERLSRCPRCAAFTYDVRGLSEEDVRRLVLDTEGRVLTRLVARRDGRVMSFDCGHGTLRPARRWKVLGVTAASTILFWTASWALAYGWQFANLYAGAVASIPEPVETFEPQVAPPEGRSALDVVPSGVEVQVLPPQVEAARAPVAEVHLADVHLLSPGGRTSPVSPLVEELRSQLDPVQACYARRLKETPRLRSSLQVSLSLEDGWVRSLRFVGDRSAARLLPGGSPHQEPLKACVEDALRKLTFDRRGSETLSFRLIFETW